MLTRRVRAAGGSSPTLFDDLIMEKAGTPPPPWPCVMNLGREFAGQLAASARCACCARSLLSSLAGDLALRDSTAGAAVVADRLAEALHDGHGSEAATLLAALQDVLVVSPPHDEVLITAAVSAAAGSLLQ